MNKYLLGDQEADSLSFPSLEQLDDIWMIKWPENIDLVLERFVVRYSGFLHCLDCNFFTCRIYKKGMVRGNENEVNLPVILFLAR